MVAARLRIGATVRVHRPFPERVTTVVCVVGRFRCDSAPAPLRAFARDWGTRRPQPARCRASIVAAQLTGQLSSFSSIGSLLTRTYGSRWPSPSSFPNVPWTFRAHAPAIVRNPHFPGSILGAERLRQRGIGQMVHWPPVQPHGGNLLMSNLPEPRLVELCVADHVLTLDDLWLRCFALGTTYTPTQLGRLLRGERLPSRHEYNVVAVAMNEYLSDIGAAQSVPYIEQLEPSDHPALPPIASLGQSGGLSDEPRGRARPGSASRGRAEVGQEDGGRDHSGGGLPSTIRSSARRVRRMREPLDWRPPLTNC